MTKPGTRNGAFSGHVVSPAQHDKLDLELGPSDTQCKNQIQAPVFLVSFLHLQASFVYLVILANNCICTFTNFLSSVITRFLNRFSCAFTRS